MELPALELETLSAGFVLVPAGRFLMGSPDGLPHAPETPVHEVEIPEPFWMARTPTTQSQYRKVVGSDPSFFSGSDDRPVESVSWAEANEFCARLSEASGRTARLPSEAEWEYAYRAGSTTSYFFGEDSSLLSEYAWFEENSGMETRPVGQRKPNAWGLLDMAGNVWEWCADVWHGSYDGAPGKGQPWTAGLDRQPRRSVRGGAWDMDRFRLRASYRSFDWFDARTPRLGFRVVLPARG